jgi:signal transduction histidine kinase
MLASRAAWFTVLPVAAAVVAVNAAALLGMAVARRALTENAQRDFHGEILGRARTIEVTLSKTRADLAFLSGSSAIASLGDLPQEDSRESELQLRAAGANMLLFMRSHAEVMRLDLMAGRARTLLHVPLRGGVPVLVRGSNEEPSRLPDESRMPTRPPRVLAVLSVEQSSRSPEAIRIKAEMDPHALIAKGATNAARSCALVDAAGRLLAGSSSILGERSGDLSTTVSIRADGWSTRAPWQLTCVRPVSDVTAVLEPLTRRYRWSVALNLAAMAFAAMLGLFTVREVRRRDRLEAAAREERRVRELERRLFHAERLGTVGRLAAGIAHEINNPLEGMSNFLVLARDALGRGSVDEAREYLDRVREGIERAAGIVRQVLTHADPARSPMSRIDIREALRQTLDFVRSRKDFRHVTLRLHEGDEPLEVMGNAVTLGQAILNLVLNACEAQPDGGEIDVTAGPSVDRVWVEIADCGPGLAPEILDHLFEPFSTTKQSTGLGLSVSHGIVRQHGGELTGHNRDEGGALFRIELPQADSTAAQALMVGDRGEAGGGAEA